MSLSVYQIAKNSFRTLWPGKVIRFFRYAYQRCTRGFCDSDTYEICFWFTKIFPEMLDYLKEHNLSHPHKLDEEWIELHWDELGLSRDCEKVSPNNAWYFENVCTTNSEREKKTSETSEYASHRWDEILSEMASLFRFCGEDPYEHLKDVKFENNEEGNNAYKEFRERQKDAKNKAFALMSEWFFDLWW